MDLTSQFQDGVHDVISCKKCRTLAYAREASFALRVCSTSESGSSWSIVHSYLYLSTFDRTTHIDCDESGCVELEQTEYCSIRGKPTLTRVVA